MWSVAPTALSRLKTIRIATIPLCVMAVIVSPPTYRFAVVLGLLALFDCFLCRRLSVTSPTAAIVRDLVYAVGFFACYVANPAVPALLLYLVPLVEICICFSTQKARTALYIGGFLMAARVVALAATGHFLSHPVWLIFMSLLLVASFGLGVYLRATLEGKEELRLAKSDLHIEMTNLIVAACLKLSNSETSDGVNDVSFSERVSRAMTKPDGSEELAEIFASKVHKHNSNTSLLTRRELEVMSLMAQGKSYTTIAKELQVSEGTARAHGASILRKTNSHTRDEAVRWAKDSKVLEKLTQVPIETL